MNTQEPAGGVETISETECLDLLTTHSLGRLAVVVGRRLLIFPVNYALGDRVIAIQTVEGTKLAAARNSHVAFEIDSYDHSAARMPTANARYPLAVVQKILDGDPLTQLRARVPTGRAAGHGPRARRRT